MGIEAGKFRHRTSIDDRVSTQDENGDPVVTWTPWAENLPAAIEPLSGREFLIANQTLGQTTVRFVIRWLPGITQVMRIRSDDSVYGIVAVLPDKDSGREFITLMATMGTNDG